ncbi:tRNA (adenosine(37)-N6)-threonylcarbamoyltransferase complex dimerization subunit type 1 TsaB [Virgibacillus sp. NKC19-16]|uniref:tRNA (adenosine(37)-N6)-threonylcarbamoyltransferase complex dimerization subunit type 1 TsaB n=1 Tax=Virgibacillus salidurans TaxID=2831673 RepID=UPI001F2E68E5|nr:tRNA (adenosine(37)-N6)-threonylcarbamoyltransferase complex dimerization subunit type 1 TsaB [Virgibacillus sp. NKC19-16]UJL47114.1 tRNA (adenosine(37)-N6)-threonylcarbamoyltransferase complex dimerization subunit type 1 TsaB [Virgibacillus sp. NKC19-16]
MNILAIDTSNHVLGVAVMKDDKIAGEVVTNLAKNHSVRLMPAIDKLMREVQITPEQLDKIVVAKGPGSYTGVRIGVATAKSLAWALNIPIVGVSSLEVLNFQGRFFNGAICPFFDARRGLVYTGLYKWKNSTLETIVEETNMLMEDFLKMLAKEERKVLFLSPDISLHQKAITESLGELAVIPEGPYHVAKPSYLALAGLNREPDNLHTLTPNYLRLAEAEANWKKQQKEKQ